MEFFGFDRQAALNHCDSLELGLGRDLDRVRAWNRLRPEHIIELLERKPAMKLSFEQVLPGLRQEITGRIDAQERGRIWQATEAQAQVDDTEVQALMAQQAKLPKS